MPESVEAEEVHFFHGLFRGPLLESHAISSNENTGAIVTEATVDENLLPWFPAKQRQELNHLFVRWRRPAADGDVHKAHAQRFGSLALPGDFFLVFAAEIHNCGEAQQLQFREARFFGLRAAVERLSDFAGVVNTHDLQFLPEGTWREQRSGSGPRGLREKTKWKNKKEGKRCESALHIQ